jgi:MFS transporter, ACS family, solute carrier family 17 (sodium-dependent inorganic phosphate cotransporter), other
VWSLIIAQIGHDWGFVTLVTDLPLYMNDVLHFSIGEVQYLFFSINYSYLANPNYKQNGLYSSLPYLVMWIVSISSGYFADWILDTK